MRTVALLVVATLAAFAMLAAGCSIGTKSEGQLGHASFAWQECFLGCSVADNPMAAGRAHAEISVSLANGYSFNHVSSSNPSVATAVLGGSNGLNLALTSGSPGQTEVQLLDSSDSVVDQVTVTVTQTAKLSVAAGWSGTAPIVVEGSTQSFHVTTVDANNHTLIGTGSVLFDVADPLRREVDPIELGDAVAFSGHAGAATITARAPATSLVQPVTVVPLSAVTSLSATVSPNTTDSAGVHANVTVVANSAGGAVYGVRCSWSIADPSVMLQSESTTNTLDNAPASTSQFLLTKPGTFNATCVSGDVSTVVTLQR